MNNDHIECHFTADELNTIKNALGEAYMSARKQRELYSVKASKHFANGERSSADTCRHIVEACQDDMDMGDSVAERIETILEAVQA